MKSHSHRATTPAYLFEGIQDCAIHTARRVLPILRKTFGIPKTVVDLGGGTGAWCRAFLDSGTERAVCVEHPWVRSQKLLLDESCYVFHDLRNSFPKPIPSEMALSLECVEHLPPEAAEGAVEFLTVSSDVVLFSAAIPGQVGAGHIHCRRVGYWEELFKKRGYFMIDLIRPSILFDDTIPCWYRQNLYIYASERASDRVSRALSQWRFLPPEFELVDVNILKQPPTLRQIVKELLPAAGRSIRYHFFKSS